MEIDCVEYAGNKPEIQDKSLEGTELQEVMSAIQDGRIRVGHNISARLNGHIAEALLAYRDRLDPDQSIKPGLIRRAAQGSTSSRKSAILTSLRNAIVYSWTRSNRWAHYLTAVYKQPGLLEGYRKFSQSRAAKHASDLLVRLETITHSRLDMVSKTLIQQFIREEIWPRLVIQRFQAWQRTPENTDQVRRAEILKAA